MTAWAERTAGGIARAERLDGNVGYLDLQPLLFPPSIAGEAVAAAMTLIAPADALLIDLRQCLGGDPDMVAMLCTLPVRRRASASHRHDQPACRGRHG